MKQLMQKLSEQPFYVNLPIAAVIVAATWTIPSALASALDSGFYNILKMMTGGF